MRLLFTSLAIASMAIAAPALAVTFNVTPGAITAIPNNNNFKTQLGALVPSLTHYTATGASISLSGAAELKFEYLGSESGFKNRFTAGALTYRELSSGLDAWKPLGIEIGTANYAAGAISNWSFSSPDKATPGPFGIGTEQFGIFMAGNSRSPFSSAVLYLGFDDEPGSDDDNHDDFIVRVTATALGDPQGVPEPASWAMLIAGFGLVGAAQRRRSSQGLTVSV